MIAGLRLRDGVVAQILEQEMVLLDTRGGQYFDLNPSGTVMLEALLKGASRDEIVASLTRRFAVDAERAAQDLDRLVAELLQAGLVVETAVRSS
jgi:hypothetical protein